MRHQCPHEIKASQALPPGGGEPGDEATLFDLRRFSKDVLCMRKQRANRPGGDNYVV